MRETMMVVLILLLILFGVTQALVTATRSGMTLLRAHERRLWMSETITDKEQCGPCPMAPKCNGSYRDKGCDGTGKIQGGIATVSFMSWWPIKVFRPCPSYQAAGYIYKREGQTMDQVLFSEPSNKMQEKLKANRLAELKALEEQKEKITLAKEAEKMAARNGADAEKRIREAEEVDAILEKKFGDKGSE